MEGGDKSYSEVKDSWATGGCRYGGRGGGGGGGRGGHGGRGGGHQGGQGGQGGNGQDGQNGYRGRGGRGGRGGFGRGGRGGGQSNSNGLNFTHFFSFPLWDNYAKKIKEYQDRFDDFIAKNHPFCSKKYKFQSHKSQHLTISMVDLTTDTNKELAVKSLKSCHEEIKSIAGGILKLQMDKVETFHGDQKRVYFLSVNPKSEDFQKFLDIENVIIQGLITHGIITPHPSQKYNFVIEKDENGKPKFHNTPHATFLRVDQHQPTHFFQKEFPPVIDAFNETIEPFGEVILEYIDIWIRWDFAANGSYNHLERIYFK